MSKQVGGFEYPRTSSSSGAPVSGMIRLHRQQTRRDHGKLTAADYLVGLALAIALAIPAAVVMASRF